VHANASLFKAPEIKRAVQGGQAQAGEVLLVNFQNEWQLFGADGLPFLADSYAEAMKLYRAQKPLLEKKLAEQGMMLLYSVPWPPQGIYTKKPLATAADLKGIKWRAYSPATARIAELVGRAAGHGAGRRAEPGLPPAWSKA
jgi:TRAP-type C4-dicarboxylate transport system substrate-binding protein